MFLRYQPLDFDLSSPPGSVPRLPAGCAGARVLVRWDGVPIGVVQVPAHDGELRRADLIRLTLARHTGTLAREAVRRALLGRGIDGPVEFQRLRPSPAPWGADTPLITVAVCTRDRPEDLARCLAALRRLDYPRWECLVVDNAPATDATARLVAEEYPAFRYIREDRPGLDHARNRAIGEARGEIIAFTDDDVVVDPRWLTALATAFVEDPQVGLVTGLIEPLELETEAQVLFEAYGGFGRGCVRRRLRSRPGAALTWSLIGAGQLGAGANMAVRRSLFDSIGRFDPALDVGTPTRGGGDHEIFHRLLKSGCVCVYEPNAVVRHRHRRTLPELRRLLSDYGHATRCFFERVALNFPEDAPGVRRLSRWWWQHWAWSRWLRAAWRPAVVPRDLVWAEIQGFREGRGGYVRARRAIVPDETQRPDAFELPPQRGPAWSDREPASPFLTIDVSRPLEPLPLGAEHAHLDLVVTCRGRTLGSLRLRSDFLPVGAARLADEIAARFALPLLDPDNVTGGKPVALLRAQVAALAGSAPAPAGLSNAHSATVIVTTCDRPEPLERCLRSLQRLQTSRRVQLLVVDNRPGGDVRRVLREFPDVELVEEYRAGSSYARNAGVAVARGDFIAMTDDDMEVSPDWLEKLLAPFSDPAVLAVTGNTLPARVETHAERCFEAYGGFGRGFTPRRFDPAWFHRFRRAVPTWQIGGSGNAAFRAELFGEPAIGGFDETLGAGVPTGVGEDTKLFYDILRHGGSIAYEPAAIAWHHHRVSVNELRRQLFAYSKGHVAYHLVTLLEHGDGRALVRLFAELPAAFASRAWAALRGRSHFPLRLLWTELLGTLVGPWSLWSARRNARRLGRGARRVTPDAPAAVPSAPLRLETSR